MKNLVIKFVLMVTVIAFITVNASAQKVFMTKTGNKYHTKDCQYAKGGEAINLKETQAKKLTACATCNPDAAVYVTKSGSAFHSKDCQHAKDGEATSLADAKTKKLTACTKCNPDGGKPAKETKTDTKTDTKKTDSKDKKDDKQKK